MTNAYSALRVVAAENHYGSVAKELGGPYVEVTSIIHHPNQDPHLFSISPRIVKLVESSDIVILNGLNYDSWIKPLLANYTGHILDVSELLNLKSGSNPHIWYAPNTMPVFAKALTQIYIKQDPTHQNYYIQQLNAFNQDYQRLYTLIDEMHTNFNNMDVIATESLFNEMAKSIGFNVHGLGFQERIMNDVPPSISQIKEFEDALNQHSVHLLIYNKQVSNPVTYRMQLLAKKNGIPTVGVTETLPEGETFVSWMINVLTQINNVLQKK